MLTSYIALGVEDKNMNGSGHIRYYTLQLVKKQKQKKYKEMSIIIFETNISFNGVFSNGRDYHSNLVPKCK